MENWQDEIIKAQISQKIGVERSMENSDVSIFLKSFKENLIGAVDRDSFDKSWSSDLQSKFPSGSWKTLNGARVFVNNGKVVAGLDGFNGEIDKFFDGKGKKESKKPVNERSQKEIHEEKQKIANSMPKPINKMTWEEFKRYGVEMQKQSAHSQPDSYYERMAKMEHDWAIKNDKSQYAVSDKQKQSSGSKDRKEDKNKLGDFETKMLTSAFERLYGLQDSLKLEGRSTKSGVIAEVAKQSGLSKKFVEDNFEKIQNIPPVSGKDKK